ncbi:hypothetical protein G7Z17_g8082 [Cylindrodendrum hubeiense]|uniref:Uncharacterized protein n=1 Tax=Cylindrodendrum hubeiense TaxID=595255 RepID=A0A9P5H2M1_9HYPO|nr:hypothetical protein G7Z17_g8082 [Cylindrodendrum hubeiense]
MYQEAHLQSFTNLRLAEESRRILRTETPLPQDESVVGNEVMTLRFFRGTIIWLDITASITAGTSPSLFPSHISIIGPQSQTRLETIMGCKNWVMVRIGRIAALHEQKCQAVQQGIFSATEFGQTAKDIGKDLQRDDAQAAMESLNICETHDTAGLDAKSDPPTLVTRLFAMMAPIYLHLITHGYQNLELAQTHLSETMEMLQSQSLQQVLPALVCPLFVIGSAASQSEEQVFRDIFSSPPLLDPWPQHRGRILPILEDIWRTRRLKTTFTWEDSLDLAQNILLI